MKISYEAARRIFSIGLGLTIGLGAVTVELANSYPQTKAPHSTPIENLDKLIKEFRDLPLGWGAKLPSSLKQAGGVALEAYRKLPDGDKVLVEVRDIHPDIGVSPSKSKDTIETPKQQERTIDGKELYVSVFGSRSTISKGAQPALTYQFLEFNGAKALDAEITYGNSTIQRSGQYDENYFYYVSTVGDTSASGLSAYYYGPNTEPSGYNLVNTTKPKVVDRITELIEGHALDVLTDVAARQNIEDPGLWIAPKQPPTQLPYTKPV